MPVGWSRNHQTWEKGQSASRAPWATWPKTTILDDKKFCWRPSSNLEVQLTSRLGWSLFTTAQRLRQATPCPAFSMTSVSELWLVTLNPMHSFSQILAIWTEVGDENTDECRGWMDCWTSMKSMPIRLRDKLGHLGLDRIISDTSYLRHKNLLPWINW